MRENGKKGFRKYKSHTLIPNFTLLCDHRHSLVLPSFPKEIQ